MSEYPSDWEETTFGSVLNQRKEAGFPNEELLAVTSSMGIVRRDSLERRDTSNEDKSKYLLVQKGDIAYNTMRMWQGVSGVSRFRGIVSPAYTICTPTERLDANFAGYLLKDPEMVSVFRQRSQGLVSDTWNLKYESFAQIPCAIPPLPEQKKIAEILSGIDNTIEASCVHLDKVIQSRKVVTDKLLSNGIGHTSFSDSASGKMPTKWDLAKGNELLELGGGASPSTIQFCHNGDTLYMKVDDFNNPENSEHINTTRLTYNRSDNPGASPYAKGTIVIAKRGAAIEKNRVRILQTEAYIDTNLMTIRSTRLLPKFLATYLHYLNLSNLADMTSIPQINNFHLQRLLLPVPTMSEQSDICDIIDSFSVAIRKYRARIRKLEALKSSLSADLLSGRKRVSV